MPPSGTTATEVTDFLQDLSKSQLLAPDQLDKLFATGLSADQTNLEGFAQGFVDRGILTGFQAEKLLRRHWQGLVVGPFALLCPVGRGAMGIVYLARCQQESHFLAGRMVALKVLPPKRAREEARTLARFQRECFIGLKLPSHPNLTRTLDAGELGGVHYLAMEYVPGRNLRQLVLEQGPMSVPRAARIFQDVALGLSQAHLTGFVHRDLKPANIVILPHGQPKILDFGFALVLGEDPSDDPRIIGGSGYTVGTMDYLAPEQAQNAATVTPLADVYSLGCCLYFALTGSHPFPFGTAQEKIRAHRWDRPRPIRESRPDLPAEFIHLVEWCLEKKPENRPESMAVLAQHLSPWAEIAQAGLLRPLDEQEQLWLQESLSRWQKSRNPNATTEEVAQLLDTTSIEPVQATIPIAQPIPPAVPVHTLAQAVSLGRQTEPTAELLQRSGWVLRRRQVKLALLLGILGCLLAGLLGLGLGWLLRG